MNSKLPILTRLHNGASTTWSAEEISLDQDKADWEKLSERERLIISRTCGVFELGESSVTDNLEPFSNRAKRVGARTSELEFLATFQRDEQIHTLAFQRFLTEVVGNDFNQSFGRPARKLFQVTLPRTMNALNSDDRPQALVRAAVTYNVVVEGAIAVTGLHALLEVLVTHNILPGLQEMVRQVLRDESRHLAYGNFVIRQAILENPSLRWTARWQIIRLLPVVMAIIGDVFRPFQSGPTPFNLKKNDFVQLGIIRLWRRYRQIMKGATQQEILDAEIENEIDD